MGETDGQPFLVRRELGDDLGWCYSCIAQKEVLLRDAQAKKVNDEAWREYLATVPEEYRGAIPQDGNPILQGAVREWAQGGHKRILYLAGSAGIGKTRMAWSIAQKLKEKLIRTGLGREYMWVDMPVAASRILSMGIQQRASEVYQMTRWGGILILDDLGNENALIRSDLYPVIQYRSQWTMGMVITSEYSLDELCQKDGYGQRWGSRIAQGICVYVNSEDRRLSEREASSV